MGYSDISIGGSDMAWDLWAVTHALALEGRGSDALLRMHEELDEDLSEYNTPGDVNVALVLVDPFHDTEHPTFVLKDHLPQTPGYHDIVCATLGKLEERRKSWAAAEWGGAAVRRDGSDNKQWHLNAVDRLLAALICLRDQSQPSSPPRPEA